MADLKAGTTVGGAIVWHQGNFPLRAVSNDVYYKEYKIYTEFNKPKATDNDFVSKASGGVYLGKVTFDVGLNIKDRAGYIIEVGPNTNTDPMYDYSAKMRLNERFAIEKSTGQPFILFNPEDSSLNVMGDIVGVGVYERDVRVFSKNNPPLPIDVSLGNVTNDKQVKIETTETQTMLGPLVAPNFSSQNPATNAEHVPRYDQVVVKDSIIDFGPY